MKKILIISTILLSQLLGSEPNNCEKLKQFSNNVYTATMYAAKINLNKNCENLSEEEIKDLATTKEYGFILGLLYSNESLTIKEVEESLQKTNLNKIEDN